MARGKFDLADLMGAPSRKCELQVAQIALDDIVENAHNFFEVSNLDTLADSIALTGLQQPLVVRALDGAQTGKYLLLAGHRRLAALRKLGRDTAPCVISHLKNEILEDLALIQTNTTARELTYSERIQAVVQTETLLKQLQQTGVTLPAGMKMRDRVAQITCESTTEVARMQKICKRLIGDLLGLLGNGTIAPHVANLLASESAEMQQAVFDFFVDKQDQMTAGNVKQAILALSEPATVSNLDTLPADLPSLAGDVPLPSTRLVWRNCGEYDGVVEGTQIIVFNRLAKTLTTRQAFLDESSPYPSAWSGVWVFYDDFVRFLGIER